ncbi:MAG: hypothetical protein AAB565_01670, partial [Patescibacteria group bacterium]
YILIPTVTSYQEVESDEGVNLGGVAIIRFGDYRRRTGRIVMDFRLIDTASGIAVEAFSQEAKLDSKRYAAGTWHIVLARGEQSIPERAVRQVARKAAERIAQLFNPSPPKTDELKKRKER